MLMLGTQHNITQESNKQKKKSLLEEQVRNQ